VVTSPVLALILRRKAGQPAVLGTKQPLVLNGVPPTVPQISASRAAKEFTRGTGTLGTGWAATGGAASRSNPAAMAGAEMFALAWCSTQELHAAATSPASDRKLRLARCSSRSLSWAGMRARISTVWAG